MGDMTHTIADPRPSLNELADEFTVLHGTAGLFAAAPALTERQRADTAVMVDALGELAALLASVGSGARPLTADLAHELRTPLQAALGFAELLRSGEGGAWDDCLRGVVIAARHMAELLDRAVTEEPRERRVSASTAAAQAVVLASPLARLADVRLLPVLSGREDLVRADPLRLRQAVLNLLTNAVQCSPPHGEVGVVVSGRPGTVTIAVHDRGPGLTERRLVRLLRVRRGDRDHGLGLPITRELVDAMDGVLHIRSVPGRGSCFAIRLPALQ